MLPVKREDDIISVHSAVVIGGYLACVVSMVFGIVLVFLGEGPVNEHGGLRYISEGMEAYCGYTTIVMGTCSLFVLLCQIIAAVHMTAQTGAEWCAVLQAIGWNVVLGVSDTGWTVHYIGLALFLVSGLVYHFIACTDPDYGGPVYRRVVALSIFFSILFGILALAHIATGQTHVMLRSFAVAFEFVLLGFLGFQNLLLIHALDQFQDLHLRFERKRTIITAPGDDRAFFF